MTDTSSSTSDAESVKSSEAVWKTSPDGNSRIREVLVLAALLVVIAGSVLIVVNLRSGQRNLGIDEFVTKRGNVEVTARLVEIRGKFPPNDNYNYAYVMKYAVVEVHRGQVDSKEIAVAHYNPLKPRPAVADEFYPEVGGTLKRFRAGDTHRMALEVPINDYFIGGIIDKYFQESKGPIYWGVRTNQVGP